MAKQTKTSRKGKKAGMPKLDNQIVANSGMYYVCHRLSEMGLNVMPTSRNAKGIDILAYTPDGKKSVSIQVKTVTGRTNVPLGEGFANKTIKVDFWCIVNRGGVPAVFVMKPKEVELGAEQYSKGWWLKPKAYDSDKFREKWSRIESFMRLRH